MKLCGNPIKYGAISQNRANYECGNDAPALRHSNNSYLLRRVWRKTLDIPPYMMYYITIPYNMMNSKEVMHGLENNTPLKAIRLKCIDCMCGQVNEVKVCPMEQCPLYPYRFGRNPNLKRQLSDEQRCALAERLRLTQNS